MGQIEKTVFISYRRSNYSWALAIFKDLSRRGYDVFLDYHSIPSGSFETIITENIRGRAHFLVLLTPSALDRCSDPNDWLRREVETALESRRNIVPLTLEAFSFSDPSIKGQLQGSLQSLVAYQALSVPLGYFDEAMCKLCDKYLSVPLDVVLHPPSVAAFEAAKVARIDAISAEPIKETELSAVEWYEKGFKTKSFMNESLPCFNEAIRLNPDMKDAYDMRAIILGVEALSGECSWELPLEDWNNIIRLEPMDAESYHHRAFVHKQMGNLNKAMKDLNKAIELDPTLSHTYFVRGMMREDAGDETGAHDDYSRAIKLAPQDSEAAYFRRAFIKAAKGDFESSHEDLVAALRIKPDFPEAKNALDIVKGNLKVPKFLRKLFLH